MPYGFGGAPTAQRMQQNRSPFGFMGGGNNGPKGISGSQSGQTKYTLKGFRQQLPGRDARTQRLTDLYDQNLANPTGAADQFSGYFQKAAEGFAAPALRDFRDSVQGVAGNVASRFGGNASSEEQRQVGQASDSFSRNLTESLSRLAPEALQAGQQYTQMLGDASGGAQDRADRIRQMILEGVLGIRDKPKSNTFGQIVGTGLGVAGALL